MTRAEHWDTVYDTKAPDDVSWFQREPTVSVRLLTGFAPAGQGLLDVGAGASVLADRVLAAGFTDLTLLDVSGTALAAVQERLGDRASYAVSDLLAWRPTRTYGSWHDRAVFHFLTSPADQQRYVALATEALTPGGVVVLGTFAPDGPESCSGLPTTRWSAEQLAKRFGAGFDLVHDEREEHTTPWGAVQPFTWVVLRRA